MTTTLPTLDPLLHQTARTQLVAFLSGRGEATFTELRGVLNITDGNLGSHLAKLVDAGYVKARERAGSGHAQTVFSLTRTGRTALAGYVASLSALMNGQISDDPPVAKRTSLKPKTAT